MDKATILLDATRYVKELQEKFKDVEAGASSGRSIETRLVLVKRPCLYAEAAAADDDGSQRSASPGTPPAATKELPEIEVRFSEKNVMVRVHCEKSKGVAVKVLAEIEGLQLTVVHANVMLFSACTLIIAITAKASFSSPFHDQSSVASDHTEFLKNKHIMHSHQNANCFFIVNANCYYYTMSWIIRLIYKASIYLCSMLSGYFCNANQRKIAWFSFNTCISCMIDKLVFLLISIAALGLTRAPKGPTNLTS